MRKSGARAGVAAVEFAVAAPVLVLLLLGCIEYSQLIDASHTVTNASRRGARMAARNSTATAADVETYVRNYLASSYPHLGGASSSISVVVRDDAGATVAGSNIADLDAGDLCSVDVLLSFDAVRWLGFFSVLNNTTLQSSSHARRQ